MIRALAALAVALVAGCTGTGAPACDRAALVAVTETLEREAEREGADVRAIEGIAAACPRIEPGFIRVLRDLYVYERSESLAVYNGLFEARRRVCADPEGWVRDVAVVPGYQRPAIVFDRCGLARLGVLDEGEKLLGDDLDVLFTMATLERSGVDRELLRRLGRGLMNSVAPLPVAHRRCSAMPGDDACERLLAVADVEPAPTSDARERLHERPRLLLSQAALRWDGETIAALADGALRAEHVAGHQIVPLAAEVAKWSASPAARERERPFTVAADRGLAFGVVIDALYTLAGSGVVDVALVGWDGYGLVEIPVTTPDAWSPGRDLVFAGGGPIVTIDGSVVTVPLAGETKRLPADASAAISEFAARIRSTSSHNYGLVNVRVSRTTRVETVIAVLDALRGPECQRSSDTEQCLLTRPIVDQEPPIE